MKSEQIFQRSPLTLDSESKTEGLIKIGIIGGAGYTGGELIRILLNHPLSEIVFINSNSHAGKYIYDVHADLVGDTSLKFSRLKVASPAGKSYTDAEIDLHGAEVIFLCVGHGEANTFLQENNIPANVKIIDLSQDFRLQAQLASINISETRKFVYGLPEINRVAIRSAQNIANPGCFATAIQLGLLPLAQAGILKEVYTTGITGSTGAGQSLSATSHFSWRANNIQAYKTLTHQHLHEIYQSLHQLQESFPLTTSGDAVYGGKINFVPWRGDFTRGIFISSQLNCDLSEAALKNMYLDFYKDHPFTFLSNDPIHLKQVANTNKCLIQLEKAGSTLVVHSTIDNLVKGASGQAVQNMNIMFGIDESTGLKLKGNYF